MEAYKQELVDFILESKALRFGEFTLKSGRKSPFYMNAGAFVTGTQLQRLGRIYAQAIHAAYGDDFTVLFGPAYKGIPLSVATAMAYSELYQREIAYCSNRKEIKDHGDAGILLGKTLTASDRIVIIEDVTTSGKSMEETVPILREQSNPTIVGLMVSLDRQEYGKSRNQTALQEISSLYNFPTHAIITMDEVIEYLFQKGTIKEDVKRSLDAYYNEYGVSRI
ncbi:MAG: orotate phosphoribosyltransferase [Clostridium sp.]|jgi:orotate phosphoribosyltransferase|nr:orotate phosphoribosyltransferase [Clostridium sp.]